MDIIYSKGVKNRFKTARLGIILFTANVKDSESGFWQIVDEECSAIRNSISSEDITKQPIITDARMAYKKCGKDPSRYRPSADSLMRRIVKGNELYKVNNVVDVLNLISIQSLFHIALAWIANNVGYDR